MGWPQRTSRKGRLLRAVSAWREVERGWLPYRGDWQPSANLVQETKSRVATMRAALDELEASL